MSKRDEYTAKIKSQLDEWNLQIDDLSARAKEAKADTRDAYKAEMTKLRAQSKVAREKYEALKLASEDTWDKAVAEMEKVKDALVHSFKYFKSQL